MKEKIIMENFQYKYRLLKNMGWMISGKVLRMLISFFMTMFTARLLGPTNYGVIGYVSSYVAFFTSLCELGLNGIIVKELLANKTKEGEYIWTAIAMRLFSSLISVIFLMILMIITHGNDKTIIIVTFLSSISLFFHSFDIIKYWYQAKLQSKVEVILFTIAYLVAAIFKVMLLLTGKGVEWFALATTLEVALASIFLVGSYFKFRGQKIKLSMVTAKLLFSQSYHFILAGIMVAVYAQIDKIMIGQFLNIEEVGYYSVGVTICGIISFIPSAIIDSARPIIIEQKNKNKALYEKRLKQLYSSIIWMSILYGVFITVFAEKIVVILYGKEYLKSILSIRIIIWYISFSYLGAAKNIWLICEGKQRFEKWFTLFGALTNVILNLLLIPIFEIEGAAIATLITQIMTNFVFPAIPKDTRIITKHIIQAFDFRILDIGRYIKFN